MTDKQLLLVDLCGRLPYGVKASTKIRNTIIVSGIYEDTIKDETEDSYDVSFIKPYLRPMSSMTKEEFDKYEELEWAGDFEHLSLPLLDWLNKNMFDYRGLIPMGLALVAKEGMYKTE